MSAENESICCPKFDPSLWNEKTFEWVNKKFIKDSVKTFFFMPFNMDKVMKRMDEKVTKAGGVFLDALCLSEHTSKWNMDQYMAVDKEIPGAENLTMSGKFYCKTYEGPFQDTGKWMTDFEKHTVANGIKVKRSFMWYTTCPKCAKKYEKNYVAIIAQID